MASSKRKREQGEITVQAVLEYARRKREEADVAKARDPHMELYRPSNDAARKVWQQYGQQALTVLAGRARAAELRYEDAQAVAEDAHRRHLGYQLVAAGERETDRERLSWGQRLDVALLGLGVLSDVSAMRLDSEPVTGSKGDGLPSRRRDKQLDDAVGDARRAVVRLERELESGRRRLVETEVAA